MSVAEMCALAELSRAGYYRFLTTPAAGDKDIDLRDAIQRIALEFPTYGRPRMTEELHRRGWQVVRVEGQREVLAIPPPAFSQENQSGTSTHGVQPPVTLPFTPFQLPP